MTSFKWFSQKQSASTLQNTTAVNVSLQQAVSIGLWASLACEGYLHLGLSKCQMVYHTSKQTKPTCSYSVAQNYETARDTSLLFTLSHCVHIRLIPETTAHCIPGPACAGINSVCILLEIDVHQWTCTRVFWLNVHSVCSYLASLMTWFNTQFTWFWDNKQGVI